MSITAKLASLALLTAAALLYCWFRGNLRILTKVIFTMLYALSFALLLTDVWLMWIVTQCALLGIFAIAPRVGDLMSGDR